MIRPVAQFLAVAGLATLLVGADADSGAELPTLAQLQVLVDDGDYDQALTHADDYLQLHPGNRDARFLRAVALTRLERDDDALEAFRRLAEQWPNRPEPANNLAALQARRGDYDKARQWLERALGTQPVYAVAHHNLGDIYTTLGPWRTTRCWTPTTTAFGTCS